MRERLGLIRLLANWIVLAIGWLFLSGALSGCSLNDPISIGFAGELTGKGSDLGVYGRNGAQLAVEAINAEGGIYGRMLKLIVQDDMGTTVGAMSADRKLIEQGVVAIVGHMTSTQTLAGLQVTFPANVLVISPTASTATLGGKPDLFFRMVPVSNAEAKTLAIHVIKEHKIRKFAIVYDATNNSYVEPYQQGFAEVFRVNGGEITSLVGYYSNNKQTDYAQLVEKLQSGGAEGVLIIASSIDTALVAQKIRMAGWQVPLFSSGWGWTQIMLQNGGTAVEGMEQINHFVEDRDYPPLQKFRDDYRRRYGEEATFASVYSYEAVQVLAAALRRTGGKVAGLPEALLQLRDFSGVNGKISFDSCGDVVRPLYLVSVKNRKFVSQGELQPVVP